MDTSDLATYYRRFADLEADGNSEIYADWARGVAGSADLLSHILTLPRGKRQANLVFAAARHCGAPMTTFPEFASWFGQHWEPVRATILARATQTNEAARCAVLLPVLAELPGPLSLIEVGASAGLCLYPDRYSYDYTHDGQRTILHPADGPSSVTLPCTIEHGTPPSRLPEIAWRAGIDLNPLDVTNPDDVDWLTTLVWPEQEERRSRLAKAAQIAAANPPSLVAGDLTETIDDLIDQAPEDTSVVVFHSAVLVYLPEDGRRSFAAHMRERDGATWISNEGAAVLPMLPGAEDVPHDGRMILHVDGQPKARTGPHGQSYEPL